MPHGRIVVRCLPRAVDVSLDKNNCAGGKPDPAEHMVPHKLRHRDSRHEAEVDEIEEHPPAHILDKAVHYHTGRRRKCTDSENPRKNVLKDFVLPVALHFRYDEQILHQNQDEERREEKARSLIIIYVPVIGRNAEHRRRKHSPEQCQIVSRRPDASEETPDERVL